MSREAAHLVDKSAILPCCLSVERAFMFVFELEYFFEMPLSFFTEGGSEGRGRLARQRGTWLGLPVTLSAVTLVGRGSAANTYAQAYE